MNKIANDIKNIQCMKKDRELQERVISLYPKFIEYKYSYNFTWLGRPIIQRPQDIIAAQEIVWQVQPDLIVETGVAHGGSLILYASLLELIAGNGQVLGIDIEIREHNRVEIENHPLFKRITMIEGSSVSKATVDRVYEFAKDSRQVLVVLDSNHNHEHVLKELELYSPLVRKGSYLIVMDTIIEDMPRGSFPERSWEKGSNPKTAVWEFLKKCDRFEIDSLFCDKFLISACPDGFLKCIKN